VRFFDSVVGGVLVSLVCFTALAFGSVYPWTFKTMEVACFALICLWMVRLGLFGGDGSARLRFVAPYFVPIFLFLGYCAIQLVRLPPRLLAVVSPGANSLYATVLPGWPRQAPYRDIAFVENPANAGALPRVYILPTPQEVERGAAIPFGGQTAGAAPAPAAAESHLERERDELRWYGLSIAPNFGRTAILKGCAYAALLILIVGYPWRDGDTERRWIRGTAVALVAIGALVAGIGIVNREFWNGKILWILRPEDWGAGAPPLLRASGPFVNPDDFANYLAMILPLALAGTFYNVPWRYTSRLTGYKLISAAASLVIGLAVVLSFSRAGWIASGVAVAAFFIFAAASPSTDSGGDVLRKSSAPVVTRWSRAPLLAGAAFIAFTIVLGIVATIGPHLAGRSAAELGAAGPSALSMAGRMAIWRDSLPMIRDFPVFGVGLGAWPAVFPHYRRPPWFPLVYREAHNDYLQLVAETGAVGGLLALWIAAAIVRGLLRRSNDFHREDLLLIAALAAAVPAMAVHEAFDFCFRIPANAVLFTLIAGLALRIVLRSDAASARTVGRPVLFAVSIGSVLGAIALIAGSILDPAPSFPYDVTPASDGAQALRNVLEHPARSLTHLELPQFMAPSAGVEARLREFWTAVWLDPVNPVPRDRYADELFAARRPSEALKQVTLSIYNAPANNEHFYLSDRYAPFLSDAMARAIEEGYRELLANNHISGLYGLSNFYASQQRYDDQANLLADYLSGHPDEKANYNLLIATAQAFVKAGNNAKAEDFFNEAIAEDPSEPGAYMAMISDVYAPQLNLDAARAIVEKGVNNGLDPVPLYLALLNLAQTAKDKTLVESCLRELLRRQPSTDLVLDLGRFYLYNSQPDKAVSMFRRAIDSNPSSADAYFLLGQAEEADYRYSAADDAYSRAISLAPNNDAYRQAYQAFRDRMKRDSSSQ